MSKRVAAATVPHGCHYYWTREIRETIAGKDWKKGVRALLPFPIGNHVLSRVEEIECTVEVCLEKFPADATGHCRPIRVELTVILAALWMQRTSLRICFPFFFIVFFPFHCFLQYYRDNCFYQIRCIISTQHFTLSGGLGSRIWTNKRHVDVSKKPSTKTL